MALKCVLLALLFHSTSQSAGAEAEKGAFRLYLLSHAIGEETYEIARGNDGGVEMRAAFEYSDRGTKRPLAATLQLGKDLTPVRFELKGRTTQSLRVDGAKAEVADTDGTRSVKVPETFFAGIGYTPASVQMMMMRYWAAHGKPASLPLLPDRPARNAEIAFAAHDRILVGGKAVALDRYSVGGVVFGREVLWLDARGNLAALMTFAGGLPFGAVRSEFEPAYSQLFGKGVEHEMRSLQALNRAVPPAHTGNFAIAGATLVEGTNRLPVRDSVVIVHAGKITAAGTRAQVAIPRGLPVVDGSGQTLLPGLWEMHTHYSGVEFGPATLAAGITTARDCGGEFEFLVAVRDALEKQGGLGPRLLLAGLVDAGGLNGFGAVSADNPEEARAVVGRYHAAGFQQIKLYTYLKPDVIRALSAEAHRLGMSVTGHVPAAVDTVQGVEDGMDQINHLNYVSRMMRAQGATAPFDAGAQQATQAIAFLKEHGTVVDPTVSWSEMAGHPKGVPADAFEPGVAKAPSILQFKFMAMGTAPDPARVQARMADNLAVIRAIQKAGVPVIAGSDTGLVGYGLLRELELYVQAGMTPLEAIQSATIVPARAMKLEGDSGTVEVGKRADLILVKGDPLARISDLRKVSTVIANGRVFDSARLWASVGFRE